MKYATALLAILALTAPRVHAQAPVFIGIPSVRISEGGSERVPETISRDDATAFTCVIVQNGDTYLWASRENLELVRIESGAFETFVALNGSGYVRRVRPEMKGAAALMSPTEARFDYVEHLMMGLRSVTYYGQTP
jgi:hypothetical protein